MTDMTKDRVEQLIDYIMKKCLWQFHSRTWDRERQNKGVLGMTTQILCGEPCDIEDPKEKCYWVDAVVLAEAYRERFPWINTLSPDEIRALMAAVHARLDHLTITGSLNEELTDKNY